MAKSLIQVLDHIGALSDDEQILLVRRIRTVLNPQAQHELSERTRNGF